LAVVDGPDSGKSFVLDDLPAVIGRGRGAAIPLNGDMGVSRRHAEIYEQGQALRIRDLRSAHGTHVNGFDVNDKGLEAGDRIEIGHSVLEVRPGRSGDGP
jgi:pSer/pThr/pTyr-binding forkhead associated (FHA) protein